MALEQLDIRAVPAIVIPNPGTPLGAFGPQRLTVQFDEAGHSFARVDSGPVLPLIHAVASIQGSPATLAYRLPVPVQPGDVVILGISGEDVSNGGVSDVLRFTDTVDVATGTLQGWLLVYSDSDPGDSNAADTGIPSDISPLAPQVVEFGIPGALELFSYSADNGSTYNGFSDGSFDVAQTITGITVAPASVLVADGTTQPFTATATDQFGAPLSAQPAFTWSVDSGGLGGTIDANGNYRAPTSGTGSDTVRASSGSVSGTATVAVTTVQGVPQPADAGFEAPAVGGGDWGAFSYDPTGSPWAYSGDAGVAGDGSLFTGGNPDAPEGAQVAFLQDTGAFSQQVANWAAGTYQISFDAAQRVWYQAAQQDFRVLVDGKVVGTFTPAGPGYAAYTTAAFTVAAGSHTITFQGLDSAGGDNTAFLDDVRLVSA